MKPYKLDIRKEGLFLDGKPFYLASGDMHYFRYFKDGWRRRLQMMKDFGLTAVQTYVPWDLHEPEEGKFCFEGNLDLRAFLELCAEMDMKVMFRPSVYMCSEWDLGGMPYWLLEKKDIVLRTKEKTFMDCAKRYYKRLAKEFLPYLSTKGGPIIAVAVENEYGSFGNDLDYIKATGDYMKELGVDVPLYTANGHQTYYIADGSLKEYWTALDFHFLREEAKVNLPDYQPDLPMYVAEFWSGRGQQWGGYFARQGAADIAQKYKDMLDYGAYVNFYMFCGGTNYGFQNGALVGMYNYGDESKKKKYIPFSTSYDVDALVNEYGEATEKYYACKKVLKEYLESRGIPFTGSDVFDKFDNVETQSVGTVTLTESADLLDNVKNLGTAEKTSNLPLNMEKLGQDYGFILYSAHLPYIKDYKRALGIAGLKDRATIYGNGEYLGTYMRSRGGAAVYLTPPEEGLDLDILVENMGRVNYGHYLLDEIKGITGHVTLDDGSLIMDWKNTSLPMTPETLKKVDYSLPAKKDRPAIFRGHFTAKPGVDSFVNMKGWTKGVVYINGFNLGRYWNVGPQETLYLPGELLREENTIEILELHTPKDGLTVTLDDKPMLDAISPDNKKTLAD